VDGITPGQIIDGRYQVVTELGEGGMGVVFQARHTEMDRTVAIKCLKPALLPDKEKIDRFMHEARTISRLKHHNIVNVYSVGMMSNGMPYIAMEYLQGERLSDLIAVRGYMTPEEALPIFIQVCDALAHAHQHKVVHRDIKPSNIMIVQENGEKTVKVVDFGIAKTIADGMPSVTQTGLLIGSAFYMSPGQCAGRASDLRSDVYSLGCTLFEALTGKPPFQGATFFETLGMQLSEMPPAINDTNALVKISGELQAVVDCMLQKDPANRYQSMEQLKADFERVLAGQKAAAIPVPIKSKEKYLLGGEKTKRRAYVVVAIVLASLVVAGLIVYGLFHAPKHSTSVAGSAWATRGRAQILENDDRVMDAIPVFEQAVVEAKAEDDQDMVAGIQHHLGWLYAKEWHHRGDKPGEKLMLEKGLYWLEQSENWLEGQVLSKVGQAGAWSNLENKDRLTLLLTVYYDHIRTAQMAGHMDAEARACREYVNLFSRTMSYPKDRERKATFYIMALDFLIKRQADLGDLDGAKKDLHLYEEAVKLGFVDPTMAPERISKNKALLKPR
jgi:hypothetical protein